MKYKVLLTGKNKTVIDDFFGQLDQKMEVMTTSIRYDDIMRHMKYIKPDAFVYCIYNETRDHISRMITIKPKICKGVIPFVVIGSEEDCEDFQKIAVNTADIIMPTPLKAADIEEKIINYIEKQKQMEEEARRQIEEQLAEAERKRRKHILVIDDDSTMLKTLKESLHDEYDVATAISGKVALKFLEKKTTDLILLDYEMPGENGPAVLEKLRANNATKDIPVIFLTGITEREKITKALVMKPQGYLLKPVDHEKLLEVIEKTLV